MKDPRQILVEAMEARHRANLAPGEIRPFFPSVHSGDGLAALIAYWLGEESSPSELAHQLTPDDSADINDAKYYLSLLRHAILDTGVTQGDLRALLPAKPH